MMGNSDRYAPWVMLLFDVLMLANDSFHRERWFCAPRKSARMMVVQSFLKRPAWHEQRSHCHVVVAIRSQLQGDGYRKSLQHSKYS